MERNHLSLLPRVKRKPYSQGTLTILFSFRTNALFDLTSALTRYLSQPAFRTKALFDIVRARGLVRRPRGLRTAGARWARGACGTFGKQKPADLLQIDGSFCAASLWAARLYARCSPGAGCNPECRANARVAPGCRKRDRSKRYGRVLGSMRVMRSTSLNLVNKGTYS